MKKFIFTIAILIITILVCCPLSVSQVSEEVFVEEEVPVTETATEAFWQYEEPEEEHYQVFDMEWNLLISANIINSMDIDVDTGKMAECKDYLTLPMVPVKAEEKYALYSKAYEIHMIYYDGKQQFIGGEAVTAENGVLLQMPPECQYVAMALPKEAADGSFFVKETDVDRQLYVVACDGNNNSINKAAAAIEKEGTIIIFPGTYNENVKAWGKKIDFYGVDRENCVLESFLASYYTPPLEIGAGSVRNMTIRAVKKYEENVTLFAYGVHVEDHFLYNNTLLFENCRISSDFNSAVGIGLRGGCKVEFVDVELVGKENGLFCHDSAYSSYSGIQEISLKNCVVEGLEGENAIRFDSQGVSGAEIKVLFWNNILKNDNASGTKALLYVRNNNGAGTQENWMGLKNYYIQQESAQNNVEEMNYGE